VHNKTKSPLRCLTKWRFRPMTNTLTKKVQPGYKTKSCHQPEQNRVANRWHLT